MANGTPDFRPQPQVDAAGIADLLSRRESREEAIRASRQNRFASQINQLMQSVELGSKLATEGLQRSLIKQQIVGRKGLADTLDMLAGLEDRARQPLTRAVPAEGPSTETGQRPLAFQSTTFGQTPEGQNVLGQRRSQLESQLLPQSARVSPEKLSEQIISRRFADPLDRAKKIADLAKAEREAGLSDEKTVIDRSEQLRKEFTKASDDFNKASISFQRILDSVDDPSPAGDLALIFNYMKVLDPNSVVRESEFANAENTGTIPKRIWGQYNKLLIGEGRLDPRLRRDFVRRAKKLFDGQKRLQNQRVKKFNRLANTIGADPKQITTLGVEPDTSGSPLTMSKKQRFNQLISQGFSKQEAFEKMEQEGF